MRLQVPRVRVENGWALGKFAGGFAQARRLTLASEVGATAIKKL